LTAQQGVNLIATVVAEMGYLWTPTTGHSDAGIDGYIEIRRTDTGEATNSILQVQSKATAKEWENQTGDAFEFRCDERELAYRLQGNAPVILAVSPQAWAISVAQAGLLRVRFQSEKSIVKLTSTKPASYLTSQPQKSHSR
jgi:hypothetical protein